MLPVVLVWPFLLKYFSKGLVNSGQRTLVLHEKGFQERRDALEWKRSVESHVLHTDAARADDVLSLHACLIVVDRSTPSKVPAQALDYDVMGIFLDLSLIHI